MVSQTLSARGRTLTEASSKHWLATFDIPVTRTEEARNAEEAVQWADEFGYPVVMKVSSRNIVHKSDIGGVILGVSDATAVRETFEDLMARASLVGGDAEVQGVSVQRQVPPGTELVVGTFTDPQFGPVVMVGLGGVFVEVLGDVAFGVTPLTTKDAARMLRGLRGYPVLEGARGRTGVNMEAVEALLVAVSRFADQNPEVLALDLNPVIADGDALVAVDASIVVEESTRGH